MGKALAVGPINQFAEHIAVGDKGAQGRRGEGAGGRYEERCENSGGVGEPYKLAYEPLPRNVCTPEV